jgi:3-oxoacyl-[acyl-carrier protein] reductase
MDLAIRGKRALVTGASRGIGVAIAVNLAKEGARVAIVARTKSDLRQVMNQMPGNGHHMLAADLTKKGMPKKIIKELKRSFGKIDILVNNLGSTLGILDPYCPLDHWRAVYRINFEVAVELNNLVIPHMKKRQWGRIVNISSTSGMENNGPVTYCAMKAALTAYSRSMGRILAKEGIVMSALLPGAVFTKGGFWDKALKERPAHVEKYLRDRCPLGKLGEPDDIGTMVAVLCSEQAKFCQGAIFPVDGGQSRHYFFPTDF